MESKPELMMRVGWDAAACKSDGSWVELRVSGASRVAAAGDGRTLRNERHWHDLGVSG
jgi:hypothetical protein